MIFIRLHKIGLSKVIRAEPNWGLISTAFAKGFLSIGQVLLNKIHCRYVIVWLGLILINVNNLIK